MPKRIIQYSGLVLLHLFFWGFTAYAIIRGFSIDAQEIEVINGKEMVKTHRNEGLISSLSFIVLLCFIAFYTLHFTLIGLLKKSRKAHGLIIGISIGGLLLAINYAINCGWFSGRSSLPQMPNTLIIGISLFYLGSALFSTFMHLWLRLQKRQQQLLVTQRETELQLLRNQLQPHFLFNALNNLLFLIKQDEHPKLSKSIHQLSNLLRFSIEESRSEKVTLKKEIDFLKNYAQLQLLRFEDNEVHFQFEISGDLASVHIEPGLLIPFVENAFKYGTEPETSMPIKLKLIVSTEAIHFSVFNQISQFAQQNHSTNTGIETTKKRLELVYPNQHKLQIKHTADFFEINLTINRVS